LAPSPRRDVETCCTHAEQVGRARIPGEHPGFGIVVGVIEPAGRRFVSRGERTSGDPTPLGADPASAVVLHQNGVDQRAARIE